MRVLALDTTTRAGSVALVVDDRVVDERAGDGSRTHGERLPAELAQLGASWDSIDVFAVAVGPGSFTGLRIGIATIQGLALVTGRRIAAVSALEALAQRASERLGPGSLVASWVDAQRGEVFAALYRVTDAPLFTPERLVELEPPTVAQPDAMRASWATHDLSSAVFTGDGAARYLGAPAPPLLAGAIGRMGAVQASREQTISPAAVHPLYIRRPDAELARNNVGR
ncbi:MAG TPA: tRNA (adenosine(37)-N6)-threonylcarbamoyltransferase complex dimerization subunit type 1 TsaB [Vicinamibacterales bacterium]|nr:tRNA (adenosine(37)-N6)-threonylcarbamoyltransferase complex dimerization subunit type 1 TsaB [Vicinamibacterales bacterium]